MSRNLVDKDFKYQYRGLRELERSLSNKFNYIESNLFVWSCSYSYTKLAKYLWEHNLSLSHNFSVLCTGLFYNNIKGNKKLIKTLISWGADPRATDGLLLKTNFQMKNFLIEYVIQRRC